MEIPPIRPEKKSGNEGFTYDGKIENELTLCDFWRWSCSDLIGNTMRGILAEFIVAMAINKHEELRNEWTAYDLINDEGIKIEVKSASYVQSWYQKQYSSISFNIPKKRAWNPEIGKLEDQAKRHSDVYVFALLDHREYQTLDPLNLNQWTFFVIPTNKIDIKMKDKKTISLKALRSLNPFECNYPELNLCIKRAFYSRFE